MTNPPQPSPVTAWALVGKDDKFSASDIFDDEASAHRMIPQWEMIAPECAPHRVVKVEIKPTGEG